MEDEQMIKIVKEIGSDIKLFSDFLAKMCIFIALDSHVDNFKCDFETSRVNCKQFKGTFKFKATADNYHKIQEKKPIKV